MSDRLRNLLYLGFIAAALVTLVTLMASAPGTEDRVEALGSRIRCPVCQGEAIIDSPAPMARDMMALVRQRVDEGATDEEIISEITTSYTGALLLDPPASGGTLWLWLAPLLALLVGISVIVWWRSHPPGEGAAVTAPRPRSRARAWVGGVILAVAAGGVIVAAGSAIQDRPGPAAGAADLDGVDSSQVSNETMEAVVSANADDPRIDGMRLALAERYFQVGDYRSAFPHYLAVAESENASQEQAHTALARLGWMAYEGNGEVETALALLDQALSIQATPVALYLKGQVLWCGAGRPEEAAALFQEVLDRGGLEGEPRAQVEEDLELARRDEPCGA
ncbi:MAG: cytochrome c-type biogenesis protein CcmH [Actinobacteria bacterium]|nr:cytochrome c-type biogenesis protein CcmH [Actinomycetota bacterium]